MTFMVMKYEAVNGTDACCKLQNLTNLGVRTLRMSLSEYLFVKKSVGLLNFNNEARNFVTKNV